MAQGGLRKWFAEDWRDVKTGKAGFTGTSKAITGASKKVHPGS